MEKREMKCSEPELFSAWANRLDMSQLTAMSGLTVHEVQEMARKNDWLRALDNFPGEVEAKKRRAGRVEANREENLKLFSRMRGVLEQMITKLEKEELTFEKVAGSKAGPMTIDHKPGSADIVNLTRALQIVIEGTAKCLGDTAVIAQPRTAGNAQSAENQVVVLIPSVLSDSRAPQILDVTPDK